MEKLGEFDFSIEYVLGMQNVLTDSLSQLWFSTSPGTVHACGMYTYHNMINNNSIKMHGMSMPILVGIEAACLMLKGIQLNN